MQIQWENCRGGASQERITLIEKKIGVTFPSSYVEFIKKCDGGVLKKRCFTYQSDNGESIMDSIGVFLSINQTEWSDFLSDYDNPPEFFPDGLVAFGENGGGDLICFDYRQGKDESNPQIVYWNHEADVGKDVFFIANNFEDFLKILN